METILLTGATGFFGSRLAGILIQNNYNVIALKRSGSSLQRLRAAADKIKFYDIDRTDIDSVFRENKINVIIHTAVNYGRNNETAAEVLNANVVFPLSLLEAGLAHNIRGFINTDTFSRTDYGRLKYYTLTKKQFAGWLNFFSDKTAVYNMIVHHIYGGNDSAGEFIPHVIKSLLDNAGSIDLTEGAQKRDFIFVDDVCGAFLKVVENVENMKDRGFFQYEVGTGQPTSIKDIVLMIKKITGRDITLNFGALPYTENEEMEVCADVVKIYEDLKWKYKTPLEDGLKKTVEWYKKNTEI